MYDLEGSDSGREWVEVLNTSSAPVDLLGWKFFEANTNHSLTLIKGATTLPAGGFAIISDDSNKFLADQPSFSGVLFSSSFSLNNTGESLALKNGDLVIDTVAYSSLWGGAGDGKSIQKSGSVWVANISTPGSINTSEGTSWVEKNEATSTSNFSQTSQILQTNSQNGTTEFTYTGGIKTRPTESQAFARVTSDISVFAGIETKFKGEMFGGDGKLLEQAIYDWNFGDGVQAKGISVSHIFDYPGDYVVFLKTYSGGSSAFVRLNLEVVSATIEITPVNVNSADVKISNKSSNELNLSDWQISSNNQFFRIPQNTIIIPRGYVIFSLKTTGFSTPNAILKLYSPNNSVAVVAYQTNTDTNTSTSTTMNVNTNTDTSTQNQKKNKREIKNEIDSANPQKQNSGDLKNEDYASSTTVVSTYQEEQNNQEENSDNISLANFSSSNNLSHLENKWVFILLGFFIFSSLCYYFFFKKKNKSGIEIIEK